MTPRVRSLQGEGRWPPLPTAPSSPTSLFPWAWDPLTGTHPSCLWKGLGGAPTAWNKETKPHGPPAHLSSPWTGSSCSHSPASTRPPTRGRGGGVLKPDRRHPSCAPSPQPRQELATRTDGGLDGQMGALMGRRPAFLQGSGETETQGHKEKAKGRRPPNKSWVRLGSGGGLVGKVGGRQQGAKPFPFMETIFSKNKQFRCRATRELPAPPYPPQDASGSGARGRSKDRRRVEALEVTGVQGGSKGVPEAGKRRDNQGLSLTCTPRPGGWPGYFRPPHSDRVWPVLSAV